MGGTPLPKLRLSTPPRAIQNAGIKPIFVKFFVRQDKYDLYHARFNLLKLEDKSQILGADNIYINENLQNCQAATSGIHTYRNVSEIDLLKMFFGKTFILFLARFLQ